jgi:hypothetical protein
MKCADFHETHKCSTALGARLFYILSPESGNKRGKQEQKVCSLYGR